MTYNIPLIEEFIKQAIEGDAIEGASIEEAVVLLISQRDNARDAEDHYKREAKRASEYEHVCEELVRISSSTSPMRVFIELSGLAQTAKDLLNKHKDDEKV